MKISNNYSEINQRANTKTVKSGLSALALKESKKNNSKATEDVVVISNSVSTSIDSNPYSIWNNKTPGILGELSPEQIDEYRKTNPTFGMRCYDNVDIGRTYDTSLFIDLVQDYYSGSIDSETFKTTFALEMTNMYEYYTKSLSSPHSSNIAGTMEQNLTEMRRSIIRLGLDAMQKEGASMGYERYYNSDFDSRAEDIFSFCQDVIQQVGQEYDIEIDTENYKNSTFHPENLVSLTARWNILNKSLFSLPADEQPSPGIEIGLKENVVHVAYNDDIFSIETSGQDEMRTLFDYLADADTVQNLPNDVLQFLKFVKIYDNPFRVLGFEEVTERPRFDLRLDDWFA